MKKLFVAMVGAVMMAPLAFAEPALVEGQDYERIDPPRPGSEHKLQVVEMFWYKCPHCYKFEPYIEEWLKTKPDDVSFIRVPAIFNPKWELLARAYYTAELLGVLDKTHGPMFDAIHQKRKPFSTEAEVEEFFVAQGVDRKKFSDAFKSFAVRVRVSRARELGRQWKISGVPAVVVNGEFKTSASLAGSYPKLLEVVDRLIEQERAKLASAQ